MPERLEHLGEWVGSDGKKYVTDDPEVVRRRMEAGHDTWTVRPPCECDSFHGFTCIMCK